MDNVSPMDAVLTSLVLSGVVALHLAFQRSASEKKQQVALLAAVDLLDRTVPATALKERIHRERPMDQTQFLITYRDQIATVPPGLWRPLRVAPNDLSVEDYSGFKALERALRLDFSTREKTWAVLERWLAPAWAKHPELKAEALPWATFQMEKIG